MTTGAAVALGLVLLLLRSTLFPLLGFAAIGPDLAFPLVVFYGVRGRFVDGVILALVLGYLADLMAGGPQGFHLFHYMLGFALAQLVSGRVALHGLAIPAAMVFAFDLVGGTVLALLYGAWGEPIPRPAGGLLLGAALTALFSLPLIPVLRTLERVTRKKEKLSWIE